MKKHIQYTSVSGGKIAATLWSPVSSPVGIVQIVHGIAEHVERYRDFASYLNDRGYLVVAEDHMGHGATAALSGTVGYFTGGWWAAIEDTCTLMKKTMGEYPGIPYVLFGHSMGSFMARSILAKYPDSGISGCVICGTGWQPDAVLNAGKILANGICKISNPKKPSALLHSIAFGAYNKRVERPISPHDWLTRDASIVAAYDADPMCGFHASAGLMRDMFEGISYIQSKAALENMRKNLPVFFIAGGDDPVGDYGQGVRKSVQAFREAGMECVRSRIYPMCRHEILNEINKSDVYTDVFNWLESVIK